MERRGRKPLATRHVERLTGSDYAKRRMETLLDSLRGVITIAKACQRLGIQETRFHKLRRQWLQESLSLLEPRRPGRRPRQPEGTPREAELAAENERLRQQLQLAEARREVAEVLAVTGAPPAEKKMRIRRASGARRATQPR